MISSEIIARYNLQVDDASELSSDEELDLAQEIYDEVANDRPWEWLKVTATGNTSTTLPYIALPADFKELSFNKNNESIVFVGTNFQEYQVIPFSSRREHRDQDGFCYIDIPNQRLYFALQPTSVKAVEYDYIKRPAALTLSTAPLVTSSQFGNLIAYGMAAKFNSIEQSDKETSYRKENEGRFYSLLSDFRLEDCNIKLAQ